MTFYGNDWQTFYQDYLKNHRISGNGVMTYYTIMPLGVLQKFRQSDMVQPLANRWHTFAPLVEFFFNYSADTDAKGLLRRRGRLAASIAELRRFLSQLHRCGHLPAPQDTDALAESDGLLENLIRAAYATRTLSLDQTHQAVNDYLYDDDWRTVRRICKAAVGVDLTAEDITGVNAYPYREGHTSSIWKIGVTHRSDPAPILFCLNVARDLSAATDDLESYERFYKRCAASLGPGDCVRLYESGYGRFVWFNQWRGVKILAVEWLADARELHVLRRPESFQHGHVVMVHEFHTPTNGCECGGFDFTPLTIDQSDELWSFVLRSRVRLAHIDTDTQTFSAPRFELNHGDVVGLCENDLFVKPTFIACDPDHDPMPLALWPYAAALSRAIDDCYDQQDWIYWHQPRLAVQTLIAALRGSADAGEIKNGALVQTVLDRAKALDVQAARQFFAPEYSDPRAGDIIAETHKLLQNM